MIKEDVTSKIAKNNLKLPQSAKTVKKRSPKITLSNNMLVKLRDAAGNREALVRELFRTDFTNVPECFLIQKNLHLTRDLSQTFCRL